MVSNPRDYGHARVHVDAFFCLVTGGELAALDGGEDCGV